MRRPHVIILTGLSGAGRSQAANALEDSGFFVVDNLPADLVPAVVDSLGGPDSERGHIAIVVDSRGGLTAEDLESALNTLRAGGIRITVLFLDATDAVLIRRFEETRRRHPVEGGPLSEKIATERAMLAPIRGDADIVIDTSNLNVHELRRKVGAAFEEFTPSRRLQIEVISFGFKHGTPSVVDVLFDVRFLPNPHWVDELRKLTGRDRAVAEYVFSTDDAGEFLQKATEMLDFLIPRYEVEGKLYLTIGIGCTGGRHRSVAMVEAIGKHLTASGRLTTIHHRDVAATNV
ncbi:RNase adapter protein RapZ [hydrothermal vent metagenome]|uniref:RNase adapter protein RapZ n=1 Tax=hydrothermal vent metagenome TaxID=652676 RepID=A0A3B0SBG7_9ZZZZ